MATLSITIPDAIAARVINAVVYNNGYTDNITDINGNLISNPVTKAQFCKKLVQEWVKNNVRAYESSKAAELARQSAITEIDSSIILGD